MLINSIKNTLSELSGLLNQLSNEEYCFPFPQLSNSTVGQHVRHIIELFQCLENQYENEQINYDIRKRDNNIETNVEVALNALVTIINSIEMPNKNLILQQEVDGDVLFIETNYRRELLYNLEHCIHHQALIKVALLQMSHLKFNDNFGVARSTIEYRKKCAQ